MRLIYAENVKKRADCYPPLVRSVVANILSHTKTVKDAVEVVRCKDCKHRPTDTGGHNYGRDMEFPDEVCPCQVDDCWYSWMPDDDWFCANGERKDGDNE